MQATDGILEFTDLMIVHAGNGFRLSFARYVGGMNPVESIPLDLAVGAPSPTSSQHPAIRARVGQFYANTTASASGGCRGQQG